MSLADRDYYREEIARREAARIAKARMAERWGALRFVLLIIAVPAAITVAFEYAPPQIVINTATIAARTAWRLFCLWMTF